MSDSSSVTPYGLIGGEKAVLSLVDRFYFYMDILPEARDVRKLHPQNLTLAKQKLFEFLSGWLGGPNLFIEAYGHPRLRQRHFPFAIGEQEAEQWLLCMHKALFELSMDETLREQLWVALSQLAKHMINR
jgi:hemoglobin